VPASKTLSPLVRLYQRLGINGPGRLKTARLGNFSNPEALFVLVACFESGSGLFQPAPGIRVLSVFPPASSFKISGGLISIAAPSEHLASRYAARPESPTSHPSIHRKSQRPDRQAGALRHPWIDGRKCKTDLLHLPFAHQPNVRPPQWAASFI
jgi:hypothetical protein